MEEKPEVFIRMFNNRSAQCREFFGEGPQRGNGLGLNEALQRGFVHHFRLKECEPTVERGRLERRVKLGLEAGRREPLRVGVEKVDEGGRDEELGGVLHGLHRTLGRGRDHLGLLKPSERQRDLGRQVGEVGKEVEEALESFGTSSRKRFDNKFDSFAKSEQPLSRVDFCLSDSIIL